MKLYTIYDGDVRVASLQAESADEALRAVHAKVQGRRLGNSQIRVTCITTHVEFVLTTINTSHVEIITK